jgi:murein DD-endopeptidase MepM/ murein hydrolase activator NlpD
MRTRVASCNSKRVLKIVAAALLAGASAACSDASRFGENPFTNPFSTAATGKVDRMPTNSLPSRSAPVGSVTSQPLPPMLPRPSVSNPLNPAQTAATSQPLPRVASATLQQASPVGGSAAGWTANGGTPVTVGTGETASTLSARYGVPAAAISAANGGQIRSGQQAIIPVYNAQGAASRAIAPAPVAAAPAAAPPIPARPVAAATPLPQARPAAPPSSLPTVAAAKPATPVRPAKPEADDDDEDETPKKIIAAAPAKPVPAKPVAAAAAPAKPLIAAAKPVKPVQAPKVATEDDDDDEETPKKTASAPKPAEKPVAVQAARPQPRVIPLTPQAPKAEEAPPKVAQVERADTTTTQSIPAQRPAPAAEADSKADFRWPARGRVISGFGSKGGNGDGIAIAVPEGTPVKAAGDGVVAYAGEELKGYGKLVLVRHENGYVSAYAHNGDLNVKRGEKVSRGQTIAKSGATGNVTSPQLHFELRKGSTPVDPTKYLEN